MDTGQGFDFKIHETLHLFGGKVADLGLAKINVFNFLGRDPTVDDANLDPKTACRFPILSGGFERELEELRSYLATLKD